MVRLRVKEVLKEKKISMSKASHMADLSYNTVQELCRNPYHEVSITTLNKLARALGVTVADLIEDVPDKPDASL